MALLDRTLRLIIMADLRRLGCLQRAIRAFLKVRTSYDVLPLSFRLIIFDTSLLVKKSLDIMIQNGEYLVLAVRENANLISDRKASCPRHCGTRRHPRSLVC